MKAHQLLSTTRNLWGLRVSDVIAEWSAVIAAVVRARYTGYRRAHATLSLAILGIADLIMQLAFVAISFGATESYAFLEDAQSAACTNIEGALAMEEMLSYFEDMKYLGVIELFICALGLFMDAVNADGKDSWKMAITQVSLFLLNASLSTVAFVVISSKAQKGMESLFSAMYKIRASSNGRIERTEEVKNEISWCIQMFIGDACKPLGVPPPFNGWLILLFTLLGLMVVFTCVYATQKGYDYVKSNSNISFVLPSNISLKLPSSIAINVNQRSASPASPAPLPSTASCPALSTSRTPTVLEGMRAAASGDRVSRSPRVKIDIL